MWEDIDEIDDGVYVISNRSLKKNINIVLPETWDVNNLLDEYNDYMLLYEMFGDEKYLKVAQDNMMILRMSQ